MTRCAPRASTSTPTRDASVTESLLAKFKEQCAAEAEEVRALGGLYVLGSERHESRRIDNQLRGRSGRQGDPGESRFYLSLEDELMRLFATGAVSWVMGRALPDDVPIEARMVTKAIERAQNTVEGRNAETRKELLKYDEVRNEQRKVIYAAPAADHRRRGPEGAHRGAADRRWSDRVVADNCPSNFPEDWDLEGLVVELTQYYPTQLHRRGPRGGDRASSSSPRASSPRRSSFYDERETTFPGGAETAREIERSVMIQIIDQRWREHLVEMDYLNEGIHLRGIAQTDPLVAWQREGFEMFGKLMDSIDDDYLRYVMHVQVLAEPAEEPDFAQAAFEAADDPAAGLDELSQAPGGVAGFGDAGRTRRRMRSSGGQAPRRGLEPTGAAGQSAGAPSAGRPPRRAAGRSRPAAAAGRADLADGARGSPADRRPRSAATSRAGVAAAASSRSATARAERSMARAPDDGPGRPAP